MANRPKIIILRGNSGSGKTTIAKLLRDMSTPPAVVISQDLFRREIVKEKERPGRMISQEMMLEAVKIALKSRRHVIIEGIFYTSKYEEFFTSISRLNSGQCYFFYFDIPFEETLRRHQMKPNAHEFGEMEMREWWHDKDLLGKFKELVIDDTMKQGDVVKHIQATVGGLN